jgi:phospholipase C
MRPRFLLLAVAAALIVVVGCGSSGSQRPQTASASAKRATAAQTTASHVVVIVMENKEYGQVIGSRSSPYVTALARRYAAARRFYGIRHPSLPNYLALTGGSTFGVKSDCTGCQQSGQSIADQLDAAQLSWKAYMGGMPRSCFKGTSSGRYAKKHDPFMYYRSVADNPARCANVVPEKQLASDIGAGTLPSFSFLAPDLCDDSHDCGIATGDRYLARTVPGILGALGPQGFLVLTWDEGSSGAGCCGVAKGGRIPTIVAGPGVKRAARPSTPYTHYSTLRTIEDAFGLPHLAGAASASTTSLAAVFKSGTPQIR